MKERRIFLVAILVLLVLFIEYRLSPRYQPAPPLAVPEEGPAPPQQLEEPSPLPEPEPLQKIKISVRTPGFLEYDQISSQLDKWHQEAPNLTQKGTYGKSSSGKDLVYFRVSDKRVKTPKKVVFVTACIHGNEPLAAGVVMAYLGNFLSGVGENEQINNILKTTDIVFIPVVSADSYPNSRYVDGVDPNRNFPNPRNQNLQSIPSNKALQTFFDKIKPIAIISAHTSGRMIGYPWGDSMGDTANDADYKRICGHIARSCGYQLVKLSDIYNRPIFGGEADWYYRHGAFSMVMEMGTHQQIPSHQDIQTEFDRTWPGFLYFLEAAPKVEIKNLDWAKGYGTRDFHSWPVWWDRHDE